MGIASLSSMVDFNCLQNCHLTCRGNSVALTRIINHGGTWSIIKIFKLGGNLDTS